MNWKLLGTMVTLIGVGASVALGQGTTPTIVQGDYISNVFGNSNFIKNPNAKLNATSGVTVSSATVSRSPTTPLVATSEFNVAITSANGTVTWDTRAFDAGMKGQNCEARFTYRGFASTSKVHIKQGVNTVASLNLTASTDPRIASINFPCGDLSAATTFVVTDTAILSGSPTPNEIGGIYVGLATNMANVAQAVEYGSVTFTSCSATWTTSGSGAQWESFPTRTGCSYSPTGNASAPSTNIPAIQFSNLPIGNYQIVLSGAFGRNAAQTGAVYFRARTTDGAFTSNPAIVGTTTTAQNQYSPTATFNLNITSAGSRTIEIQGFNNLLSTATIIGQVTPDTTQLTVYRFPLSSELVVKPETQNVFAGVRLYANNDSNAVNVNSWTKLTTASAATRALYGRADTTATNDLSLTIKNMPVGSYNVAFSGTFFSRTSASGDTTGCWFSISDSATAGSPIASLATNAYGDSTIGAQDIIGSQSSGVYVNTSVADRTFFVRASRAGGAGTCRNYSSDSLPVTITITPLDQPSNSALYVQGPVQAAATGAAIPSGYQGETKTASCTARVSATKTNNTWTDLTGNGVGGLAAITLEPGVWKIIGALPVGWLQWSSGANTAGYASVAIRDGANAEIEKGAFTFAGDFGANWYTSSLSLGGTTVVGIVRPTTSTTYKLSVVPNVYSGAPVWGDFSIGCDITNAKITAVRIN